ncbi:hypothetical protein SASPL_117290 [Salvia splendens]|uniref:Tyrosinase copper-binding domain-containing protein n=1 Tax=Salvia splendens TaxID=180675 RepID=A0A8X8ZW61_SALSN|nr:hypothetical protein SASPL_117290 [Salvia splendens]
MASLYLHCTAPPSSKLRPSPHPLLSKPSSFISHARRCHRHPLRASSDSDSPNGRLDRRNVLLGLGGLYGATSLISTDSASANPVQAPELDKCGAATNLNNQQILDVNCCPPVTGDIIDYKLPPVYKLRTRQSAHRLNPTDVFKYNLAIQRMKELPEDDPRSFMQQAFIHCAYCNGAYNQPGQGDLDIQVHNSWLFFPFHRWYLYFYERILGKLIDDPTFALPFWTGTTLKA